MMLWKKGQTFGDESSNSEIIFMPLHLTILIDILLLTEGEEYKA